MSVRRVCVPYGAPLKSQQCGREPLAIGIRSPTRLTAWRPANTVSLLISVACARGGCLAWLQVEGVVNTRTPSICKREVHGVRPVCRVLLAQEVSTVKYLPGWLAGPLRACFSQTFGIITFCGILAALTPLSASAVADSHPWRRRMRYYYAGRGCFRNSNRRYSCPHPHPSETATSSHQIRSLEHLNVCPSRDRCHQALFWKSSVSGGQGQRHRMCDHTVSVTLSRGSCSSRSGVISIRGQNCR